MFQISFLLLSIFVIGHLAGSSADEILDTYTDTCQVSCGLVSNNDEAQDCREKFCPNYASYLLTGATITDSTPTFVSSHQKEVAEFCATWMLHLIDELGWRRRIYLNLKECTCAAGKNCLVK